MDTLIKYANCWEDAYLLDKYLQVDEHSNLLSIASGGDNTLYLLKNSPKSVACIDYNNVQLYVTELKATAIRELDYENTLAFLGFQKCTKREQLLQLLLPSLKSDCATFWQNHLHLIKKGIIYQGKFEHYLRLFGEKIIPMIHTRKRVQELLNPKTEQEQIIFFHHQWNNKRWRLLFRIFFSRFMMSKLGRDREKFNEVQGEISEQLWQLTSTHFQSMLCQDNYILSFILNGKFTILPPYLQPDAFLKIKAWLNNNKLNYIHGNVEDTIQNNQTFNRFNLSNIFEYMSQKTSDKLMSDLLYYSANESRISYWNLFVQREMPLHEKYLVIKEHNNDRGFFYSQFLTYEH